MIRPMTVVSAVELTDLAPPHEPIIAHRLALLRWTEFIARHYVLGWLVTCAKYEQGA
jgi:hypothetical protein